MTTHLPPRPPSRILIVDDEAAQVRALCDTLRDRGYDTTGFTDPACALAALRQRTFDVLLADLSMPGLTGIELLQEAQRIDGDLAGIIMTGDGTVPTAVAAMKSGALDYILKPFKLGLVLPVIERALALRHLRLANAKLERDVRQRTAELEAANRELDAFVRSASHDLRSPLMAVMICAEQLIDEHGPVLPAAGRRQVEKVIAGAERMKHLIDDLLRLSGVGRRPLEMRPVQVAALVEDVLGELRAGDPARDIEVRIGELGDCIADPGLLRQVFANLLSNAYKFTRETIDGMVEVSCRAAAGEKIYSVKDNGAGFDMQRAANLFGAFQRLHSASRFEGNGIGLSIVQRIVERHGGRIWAEAEIGRGAAFHFALPDDPDRQAAGAE